MKAPIRPSLAALLLVLSQLMVVCAWAQGVDPTTLTAALAGLPRVDVAELDQAGHLIDLQGALTPTGPYSPKQVALAFLAIHRGLYPQAPGTVIELESMTETGAGPLLVLRQSVDGYRAGQSWLEVSFDLQGVLTRVQGIVLHPGDLPLPQGSPMEEEEAIAIGREHAGEPGELVGSGATRVLSGPSYQRCWTMDLVYLVKDLFVAYHVTIDAVDGTLVTMTDEEVTEAVRPWMEAKALGGSISAKVIDGCVPLQPSVGEFSTLQGTLEWQATSMTSWYFDDKPPHSSAQFTANPLEFHCGAFPNTGQCSHGRVHRFELELPRGYERVEIQFGDLGLPPEYMTLRWDFSSAHAAAFLVAPQAAPPPQPPIVTLDLASYPTWQSHNVATLMLEFDEPPGASGWIERLDILPGPWLRFCDDLPPELHGMNPLRAGFPYSVEQCVKNFGCDLLTYSLASPPSPPPDPHAAMRRVDFTAYKMVQDGGVWRRDPSFTPVVCSGGSISGSIPAGHPETQTLCTGLVFPVGGHYTLEASFPLHPEVPIVLGDPVPFYVEDALGVNLSFTRTEPVEASTPWSRLDYLNFGSTFMVYFDVFWSQWPYVPQLPGGGVAVVARAREHEFGIDDCSGTWPSTPAGSVTLVSVGSGPEYMNPVSVESLQGGAPLHLVDLLLEIDPADEVAEDNEDDNTLCLSAWIPAVDVGESVGSAVVNGDPDRFAMYEHGFVVWDPGNPPHPLDPIAATWDVLAGGYYGWALVQYNPYANEVPPITPRLWWFRDVPEGHYASGALIRYRRSAPGHGDDPPYLALAAEELQGPSTDFPIGVDAREQLLADGQWHVALWRRGSHPPFGDLDVPIIEGLNDSERTTDEIYWHLEPDHNCIDDDPDCNTYPETLLDYVVVWGDHSGGSIPSAVLSHTGLRHWNGIGWAPLPAAVDHGTQLSLAAEFKNVGNLSGTWSVAVTATDSLSGSAHTGNGGFTLPKNALAWIPLSPAWTADPPGSHLLTSAWSATGGIAGARTTAIQVGEPPATCDFRPIGLVYSSDQETTWLPLPANVSPHSDWMLGLNVHVVNCSDPPAPGQVTVQCPGVTFVPGTPEEQPFGRYVYPLSPTWNSGDPRQVLFHATVSGDQVPTNNTADYPVQVGCETRLTLPVGLTGGR